MPQSELDQETVKTILSEYKIHNADITLKYDTSAEDLIDVGRVELAVFCLILRSF